MKNNFLKPTKIILVIIFVLLFTSACRNNSPFLDAPGTVFFRQNVKNIKIFREVFLEQRQNLKTHGFSAYSLHQDLKDSHILIVTLRCFDLEKGVEFVRSPDFMSALDKADTQIPTIWYGLDTTERKYTDRPKMTGGIVIARNEVRDYKFWLDCFYKEDGGKHNHPGRNYKNSNYSIHHLPGNPEVAIVVHEASDVTKAPAFMTSDAMKGEMESTGVVGLEIWYGINLEEGLF
jgi:hypothetical protein